MNIAHMTPKFCVGNPALAFKLITTRQNIRIDYDHGCVRESEEKGIETSMAFHTKQAPGKQPVILLYEENSMSRLFGIAGVQMSVVHWDADGTFAKMSDLALNIRKQFP